MWKLNYVVVSQAGSFADWHVDFSEISVLYVLLAGEKDVVFVNETGKRGEELASFQSSVTSISTIILFGARSNLQGKRFIEKTGKGVFSQQERSTLCPQQRTVWLWEQTC